MWIDSYHILVSLSSISFGIFLFYLAHKIRKNKEFRVKLAVFGVLSFSMGSCIFIGDCFSPQYTVTLLWLFIWSLAVLYWREMKKITTSEGWHREAVVQLSKILPDYLWTTDLADKVLFMNASMKHDFYGYARGVSVFGKTLADIRKERSRPSRDYIFKELCRDGNTRWEYGKVDGRIVVYNTISTDIELPAGKKVGSLHLSREIRIKKEFCAVIAELMECTDMERAEEIVADHAFGEAYVQA